MTPEEMVYFFGKSRGLHMGICSAEDFSELRPNLKIKNAFLASFVEQDIEKRISPRRTMPEVQSIVVAAMPYKKPPKKSKEGLYGCISAAALGQDYHIELRRHLETLGKFLSANYGIQYMAFVDTGPLVDREVAKRAGLGKILKNGALCSSQFGGMVFLGYMLLDKKLVCSHREDAVPACKGCNACIRACPGRALTEEGFYPEYCISFLTQKKGLLSKQEMKIMGRQIYGCDICQEVCPRNTRVPISDISSNIAYPLLEDILSMTNRQFKELYGSTAAAWRGLGTWKRNAIIALGNSGHKEAERLLNGFLQDERTILRETATLALQIWKGEG